MTRVLCSASVRQSNTMTTILKILDSQTECIGTCIYHKFSHKSALTSNIVLQ